MLGKQYQMNDSDLHICLGNLYIKGILLESSNGF